MAQSSPLKVNDHLRFAQISTRVVLLARPLALFLGLFSLVNILAAVHTPSFDANLWWIDLHPLPTWLARVLLAASSLAMLLFALKPRDGKIRLILRLLIVVLLIMVLGNVVGYYLLIARHVIHSGALVPFSVLVGIALLLVLLGCSGEAKVQSGPRARLAMLLLFLGCLFVLPLAQIYCFGTTDYRRRADAIVVFGAQAYADGSPSLPLAERVATACRLYRDGDAPLLIFSGGPGDGDVPEPEAMRRMARQLGVPDSAILTDVHGLNTHRTVQDTSPLFAARHMTRVIAVSHFYHLPRIKMTYQRAGWDVYTVPAEEHFPHPVETYSILREVVALWSYYLRG